MEAHCINLEPKYQNQALKEGQHGQFSKVKSNEAKVKHDIDVIETINIELEHKVVKLLKENKTLKKHYKELYDSIKTTRAKNIEQTTSLIAENAEFKAQLWKPTGRIFKTIGLRWVPTGKIFTSSTTKVDSEPTNGSNEDITIQYECEQNLDVSAAETTTPSQQELDLLFGPLYDEFFNVGTLSVNKSSSPTDNFAQQDTQPSTNIHPTTEPITPTPTITAEENNDNQTTDT
ncbi:hypothetical protein Tco_0824467 [Tanacetum coccineum]|uniref:Reverse transcriptase domain-containing protein n=1 Tax=Tanacetum coccineum TaxID=301880 RepID=A0ABQ5APU2_9ASTR